MKISLDLSDFEKRIFSIMVILSLVETADSKEFFTVAKEGKMHA